MAKFKVGDIIVANEKEQRSLTGGYMVTAR